MTTNVYVLKLADECWYVGKTGDVQRRVQQHRTGHGSVWTKLHRPVRLEIIYPNVSIFDEDKYTKQYMAQYGIDKVRGGAYVLPLLTDTQRKAIQREIWGAQDVCFRCGRGHFVGRCNEMTDVYGQAIDESVAAVVATVNMTGRRRWWWCC
jgi:hypothetical protein